MDLRAIVGTPCTGSIAGAQAAPVGGQPAPGAKQSVADLAQYPLHDLRALQDIHDIISVEPARPQDKVMMGMLATIGIEPGTPFNPPSKLKAAMERGVADCVLLHAAARHETVCVESVRHGALLAA
ncbi:MAG TPA: hypothetical protein VMS22_15765 [Candidatus Eisenbacteria bacterium]|nr:hypothetical protein [Candidatus Eisenbacteria bacterium]